MSNKTRRIAGPFNRVEGDLEVQLELDGDLVSKAWVVSPMYRGFEQIMQGKDPMDSLVYVPRICGICSVAQSVAAANALAHLAGVRPTRNGELATNLILANENITDHLTHFYLFFMPDFARATYASEPWYEQTAARFRAKEGTASRDVLPARAEFLHIMGILAGRWPHSLALQPGGTTKATDAADKARLIATIFGFRAFLERVLFGDSLDAIIALNSVESLEHWREQVKGKQSDFAHFLDLADSLSLASLGRAQDQFMSFGVYSDASKALFASGVIDHTSLINGSGSRSLNQAQITEDITSSWMHGQSQPAHPYKGITLPGDGVSDGYSWCKSPRLNGEVMETGALARQLVNGHPLVTALAQESGGNVRNRIIARLLEMAIVVRQMELWAQSIEVKAPFCNDFRIPDEGQGFGMIEAARGSLGHWLTVKRGRISNYQIIAPTTWNFSPRDQNDQPGPLELALEGAPLRPDEAADKVRDPVSVQHIVRSFDPCMVCTVH
ncbi:MAG: nickel-dependent hydrogenase large subunit [Thalassolituus sp.]